MNFLQKALSKKGKDLSFPSLNAAQFLGALNDNIYKLLTIFLLISIVGVHKSSTLLSAVGAIYVIPFLLFSSAAGVLADRFSKQRIILWLKASEVLITALAIIVFFYKSIWGSYLLLFLLATHSAAFGPSKYGVIPELVDKKKVAQANGSITSFTYLAIILGTFLASFLTDATNQNYVFAVSFCFIFAILGLISAFGIKKTAPQKSLKKINPFFFQEIFRAISECRKVPMLTPCLFGSAFFLFIGAFTQLNIIPFAIESLNLSEVAGGYLFLLSALGIAAGSYLTGKVLKKRIQLGISCLAGFAISILFISFWILSSFLIPTSIILVLLGISGGVFVISFDSFIQIESPSQQRGQTIATANFLSFLGVLIASFCIFLFGTLMSLPPAVGFLCVGIISLLSTSILTCRLLETALPFFSYCLYSKKVNKSLFKDTSIFIAPKFQWSFLWKAAYLSSHCQIVLQESSCKKVPFLLRLSPNVHTLSKHISLKHALQKTEALLEKENKAFLFHCDASSLHNPSTKKVLLPFIKKEVTLLSWKEQSSELRLTKVLPSL